MRIPLRVLFVEDSESDAWLLTRELQNGGYEPVGRRVDTADAMQAALREEAWDVILCDFSMPTFGVPGALALVRQSLLDLPFIIVSGVITDTAAVPCLNAGAADFVAKDNLARLVPAIDREIRAAGLRREQRVERSRAAVEHALLEERARAAEERERLIVELREAVQARDSFLAIASHELRTPLTSLSLQVQTLRRGVATLQADKLASKIEAIARQVRRLEALIAQLLDVARIAGGRMPLCLESVDLSTVVAAVVTQLEDPIRQSGSEVTVSAPSVLGNWDRFRVETIVVNLLSNALKFGEGRPIALTVSSDARVARLIVADHGIGISPESRARIFEKFERAVPERHYGGFGLGLWIVRHIVESHGGTVRVVSEPQAGSTFTVELPLASAQA